LRLVLSRSHLRRRSKQGVAAQAAGPLSRAPNREMCPAVTFTVKCRRSAPRAH